MNLYAAIVIYNSTIDESDTCSRLKKLAIPDLNVIVADNSEKDYGNKDACEKLGWEYIFMGYNAGLSKAYNQIIEYIDDPDGIVIWLDDDTKVTKEYFDILRKEQKENIDVDIFAPVIMGQDGKIGSPTERRTIRDRRIKNPTDYLDTSRLNAINSCLAVRLRVYNDYRYDERLFLDQVDNNFLEDQCELGTQMKVMNVVINHNYSIKNRVSEKSRAKRYMLLITDFLKYASKKKFRLAVAIVRVFYWGVRDAIRYKNLKFISVYMRKAIHVIRKERLFKVPMGH